MWFGSLLDRGEETAAGGNLSLPVAQDSLDPSFLDLKLTRSHGQVERNQHVSICVAMEILSKKAWTRNEQNELLWENDHLNPS